MKNFSHKAKHTSTLANTYSMKGTLSSPKPNGIDHLIRPESESSNQVHNGLMDMRYNVEKCSNSADLPSTQNHKGVGLGEV